MNHVAIKPSYFYWAYAFLDELKRIFFLWASFSEDLCFYYLEVFFGLGQVHTNWVMEGKNFFAQKLLVYHVWGKVNIVVRRLIGCNLLILRVGVVSRQGVEIPSFFFSFFRLVFWQFLFLDLHHDVVNTDEVFQFHILRSGTLFIWNHSYFVVEVVNVFFSLVQQRQNFVFYFFWYVLGFGKHLFFP